METYQAIALVEAEPMTSEEAYGEGYGEGYISSEDSESGVDGYHLIHYGDNISLDIWLPKKVFEIIFRLADTPIQKVILEVDRMEDRILEIDKVIRDNDKVDIEQIRTLESEIHMKETFLRIIKERINKIKNKSKE